MTISIGNLGRSVVLGAALLASANVAADKITLADGSQIQGQVISLSNGVYQIQTPSMGTITLQQGQVKSITGGGGAGYNPLQGGEAAAQSMQQQALESMQQSIVQNQGLMSSIMQLQNDPDMQAVLSDPEVMRAVQSMDFNALQNNPKIKKLMNNPQMKSISGQVR